MALNELALVTLIQAKNYLRVDAAASLHIDAEYVGEGNGVNPTFTLDHTPLAGSYKVWVNTAGTPVLQVEATDYTLATATITFLVDHIPADGAIVTASYDYATTEDTFESHDDELLERLIEAATKKAEDYTERAFIQGSITERHSGDGTKILKLYRQPVVTITSVSRHRYEQVGTGDGLIVEFTLDNTPITGSVILYVDGVLQTITTDYTISGATITFEAGSTPDDGAIITANYNIAVVYDYTEQLHIGRLYREAGWTQDYIYEVVYTAGYDAGRAATQALVPDAVTAVLLILANLFENRTDKVDSINISGVGSTSYKLPSQAEELLYPLKVNVI